MKKLLLLVCLLGSTACYAQKFNDKEYTASNGVTYHLKDTVKLGQGSGVNGQFLYLQMGGWAAIAGYNANKGQDQFNIGRGYANTNVYIKKIKQIKFNGNTKVYFVINGGNITNYNLWIEDAIQACEVTPCRNPNTPVIAKQQTDKFDQLKKLKELFDSGAITQSEYDVQKKKLLDQ